MIEQILCFLVLIICLVYGLALLSWLVMKLDIEKRRSKRTKFFERTGGNLMEIEKLIERLQNWDGIKPDREIDCAIEGLKALQAENDRLQAELEKEEAVRKKQADILYELRGQKYEQTTAIDQLRAENDRLRRERDDAIRQLKFFAPCAGCKWYRGIKGCAHELGCDTNHDYYEFVAKGE